jgi:hypothetical protein
MSALTVRGIPVGSINEWNVAQALTRLGLDFDYQVPVFGGRLVPGGQVVDFLVKQPPQPIPLYVQGEYWHRQAKAIGDLLKQDRVGRINGWRDPMLIWEHECMTVQAAYEWLRRNIL